MAKKFETSKTVDLVGEYSFGKTITIQCLTLDDQEAIDKEIDKGVHYLRATIVRLCGVSNEDAGKLLKPDMESISEAMEAFSLG